MVPQTLVENVAHFWSTRRRGGGEEGERRERKEKNLMNNY